MLYHYLRRTAERRPDLIAIVDNDRRLSYAELDNLSNQLADVLIKSGCQFGDRVGLLLPKSIEAIVAIHGVLKAGCIYVPMDTSSPAARLAKIFRSCRPRVTLCDNKSVLTIPEILNQLDIAEKPVIGVLEESSESVHEFTLQDVKSASTNAIDAGGGPESAAHILFTSGSTGEPKGVIITHQMVMAFIDWATIYFEFHESDRHSGHPPLHFDLSTFDIFGTMNVGAELHLVPSELNLLPHKIAAFIREHELTQWFSVPSLLTYMAKFDVVQQDDFPHLKRMLWCGEAFPTSPLIYWMEKLPKVSFTNLYGPTEATIASSYHTITKCPSNATISIPIGTPCKGESMYVLDGQLKPVQVGDTGDLYISGVGLSPGYWKDEKKTDEVFITRPLADGGSERIYKTGDLAHIDDDSLLYFHGRADAQIKARGYRIELGEIESCLGNIETLREYAVVAANAESFDGASICCAYVGISNSQPAASELRATLSKSLPTYMLPTKWSAYEQLPKNQNGKIDRVQLRKDFEASE